MPKPIDRDMAIQAAARHKFHDGEPLNADTVVHSVKRILDPNFKSRQLSWVNTLVQAEKVDDLTVNIRTKGPDPGSAEPHVLDEDRSDRGVQKPKFRRESVGSRTVSVRRVDTRPAHRS